MKKREIARTIVDVCRNDASFCNDVKGVDPTAFLSRIRDAMPEKDFLFAVDEYLASFGVRGHLYFYKKGLDRSLGFRVRRYEDRLFITQAERGLPFARGDEIVAVDGLTIQEAAEKFSVFFEGDPPDRQGEGWETVLLYADAVTVRADETFEYRIRTDVKRSAGEPSCAFRRLNEETYYLKFTNFFDGGDVASVMTFAAKEIEKTKNLIVDLRRNCGGNDVEFLPLLKFLLKVDDAACGKPVFSGRGEILYTERNADGRIRDLEEYLKATTSDDVRAYLEEEIETLKRNRGRGFLPARQETFAFPLRGTAKPERVVVLTDYDCASSAESFVRIAAKLEKVTVVGRPTMGICDYSNLTRADFGEYVLHYPTSRSKSIDLGRGTRGRGLAPDVFIPWTPDRLRPVPKPDSDADLRSVFGADVDLSSDIDLDSEFDPDLSFALSLLSSDPLPPRASPPPEEGGRGVGNAF